ncbi:unnamed protein product [Clavelina lepadiformis]|uniref:Uncharacterized protein n=1 Tax=Clavelina lepadiformis TaxID=159417 RepID=A0ABP0GEN8_CLALP
MKNELAKVSGEIKLFNDCIQGRISSIDETVSSVKTQMNTLQRDVDRLHWRPRAQGPSDDKRPYAKNQTKNHDAAATNTVDKLPPSNIRNNNRKLRLHHRLVPTDRKTQKRSESP